MSPHLHVVIHDYWWWFLTPWSFWESSGSLCWKASGKSSSSKVSCNYSQLLVWYQVCWDFEKDHPGLPYRTPSSTESAHQLTVQLLTLKSKPWSFSCAPLLIGKQVLALDFSCPCHPCLVRSHMCPDDFCFTAPSAPLKAITRGMLVMQTCLNLSTQLSQLCN